MRALPLTETVCSVRGLCSFTNRLTTLLRHGGQTMADQILFIGWDHPVIGREQQAMQLFQKSLQYYAKLQSEGKIESFEPVILAAHGGDLNGFFFIKGDAGKLAAVQQEEAFMDIVTEARFCIEGFGVISGYIGASLNNVMSRWAKYIGK